MPESCLASHSILLFQPCPQIAPNGRFSFWTGVFSQFCLPRHTGGLWATHGRSVVVVYSLFSVVVIPGFCSMGFLLDRKFWHYPDERFTLLQKGCHVVEIARSRSVLTVPLNLFHQTERREIFNGGVNGFPIHTALLCDDSPRGKAGAVLAVAVPEQTAIHGEVSRLQFQIKDAVGNHKEILVLHPIRSFRQFAFEFWFAFHLSISYVIKARAKQKDSHIRRDGNTNRRTKLFA